MKIGPLLLIVAALAGCRSAATKASGQQPQPQPAGAARASTEQPVPVEFGRRPRNTPMTSDNMPFFDTVKHCMLTTRKIDTVTKGPAYEACVEGQEHTLLVLADAINAGKFDEADIVRCAKASRTAYEGMWYCLNGKPY